MGEHSSNNENDDDDNDMGEQVRITLTLASDCLDRSLQIDLPSIAVPASVGRKGLSAVVNHLLDRKLGIGEDEDETDNNYADDNRLPSISFDFMVGPASTTRRLLRTGLEREARRSGLSLEEAIPVTYFPAMPPPEPQGESPDVPDWIAALQYVDMSEAGHNRASLLCAGCYDGSLHVFASKESQRNDTEQDYNKRSSTNVRSLEKLASKLPEGGSSPIKCLSALHDQEKVWLAIGSMNHTLQLYKLNLKTNQLNKHADCVGGHTSAVASVDLMGGARQKYLASGDWDGAVWVWGYGDDPFDPVADEQPIKKTKTGSAKASVNYESPPFPVLSPKVSLQAHTSKVSGVSWGNYEKFQSDNASAASSQLITGSWDHSLKVWDVERQDCLLTLNGSRVVSCLDTSYHSSGIVATGHPDCTVRLWDVRADPNSKASSLISSVSDNTFRPSHKEWISAVQWSRHHAYHVASTSHDGTVKLWDLRSPLPLHTVQAFAKDQKGLSLAYGGSDGYLFVGGTERTIKQFQSTQIKTDAGV